MFLYPHNLLHYYFLLLAFQLFPSMHILRVNTYFNTYEHILMLIQILFEVQYSNAFSVVFIDIEIELKTFLILY